MHSEASSSHLSVDLFKHLFPQRVIKLIAALLQQLHGELDGAEGYGGPMRGPALTSEYTAAVIGKGVKDAVGCHDREARTK